MSYIDKSKYRATVGFKNADFIASASNPALAVQAAVDAGYKNIFIKEGAYTNWGTSSATVTIIASDVTIEGAGTGTKITLGDNVNREIFTVGNASTACNNVSFKNMYLDGNKANNTGAKWGGAPGGTKNLIRYRSDAQNSYFGVVDGVYCTNGGQNGVSNESHQYLTVRNCRSDTMDNFGFWWENANQFTITHCWSENNTLGGFKANSYGDYTVMGCESKSDNGNGFGLQSAGRGSIIGNKAYRTGWHSSGGVAANGFSISASNNCTFVGNTAWGTYGNGLVLNGSNFCTIANNVFRRCGQAANNTYADILLTNAGGGTNVRDNVFIGNTFQNDTAANYTNAAAYNIQANSTNTHIRNIFINNSFGTPATSVLSNLSTNNTIENNLGLNPNRYYTQGNVTGATTFARTNGNVIAATLTGNVTATITDGVSIGDRLRLTLTQDATGGRAIQWPVNVRIASGILALSTPANAKDAIDFIWDGSFWNETNRKMDLQ